MMMMSISFFLLSISLMQQQQKCYGLVLHPYSHHFLLTLSSSSSQLVLPDVILASSLTDLATRIVLTNTNINNNNNNINTLLLRSSNNIVEQYSDGFVTDITSSSASSTMILSSNTDIIIDDVGVGIFSPIILLGIALILGIAANGWIQQLISGEQGLGSYLSDGAGYNKSSFKPIKNTDERAVSSDPLPWLKLPKLDYVEVAGQQQQQIEDFESGLDPVLVRLEKLRTEMNEQLKKGNINEATKIRQELERVMKESGIQYTED